MDPCPVLVGRQQELTALRALLDAGGGVAIVSGEAGIGKSRLVREFASLAVEAGRIVLWGRPEEVAQPGPFALIVDLLESIAERGGGDVKKEARALESELLRSAGEDEQRPAPTPRAVAAEIRGLVSQLGAPPLIVLEDLHWADEASHSVLLHLGRAARDDGHAIVATVRGEQEMSRPSLHRLLDTLRRDRVASEVLLSPLDHSEIAEMVTAMWGLEPGSEDLERIQQMGEGVPFFVEELARSPEAHAHVVPHSVGQALQSRLEQLSPEARRVVVTASLLIAAIDPDVLAVACEEGRDDVRRQLVEAAGAGLVADHDGRLIFRHALVRDAIAGSLVSIEASRLHLRLAKAIEEVHTSDLDRHATALMRHYTNCGDLESACKYALIAGHHALIIASLAEARAAFNHALQQSGGESIEAIAGLAEVEFRDGNEGQAAVLFRRSADAYLTRGRLEDAARQLNRLAWALYGRDDLTAVSRVLDETLEWLSNDTRSELYAATLVQKGNMLAFLFNDFEAARPILVAGAEAAKEVNSLSLVAESLDGLAHVAENTGQWQEALDFATRAAETARDANNPEVVGRSHNNLAIKLASYGHPSDALDVLAVGRSYLQRGHGRAAVGALDVTNAWIARLMGRPNEVASLAARGQATWQRWRVHSRVLEAWAALEQNEPDRAAAVVEIAWAELGGRQLLDKLLTGQPSFHPEASQMLHSELLLLLNAERAEEAVSVARTLVAMDEQASEKFDLGNSLVLLGRALMASNNYDEVDSVLERLVLLLEKAPCPFLEASLLELQGLRLRSDRARASDLFVRSADQFERILNISDRARCLRLAGEVGVSDGREADAIALLKMARELSESSGARLEQNRTEALLRSLGVRPRAGRPRRSADDKSLSPRESEVVALVAEGASNSEIGHRLFLSGRTVQDHISHALKKLGLNSRAALASWAVKQGMV